MELHVTLIAPGRGPGPRERKELVARLPDGAAGRELAALVEEAYGVTGITVEGRTLDSLVVGQPPLANGALLLGGQADSRTTARLAGGLILAVRSGPAAGRLIHLGRGVHRLGRSEGEERERPGAVGLPDPELSRHHAELHVTDTVVRLVDCGSSNGTWLGTRRVRDATLETGQEFTVGTSVCSLEFEGESILDPRGGSPHGESLHIVRRNPPQRTTTLIALGVAPLAVGLGLAVFFGQWMFLAFSAMSLVSLALPLAEGLKERRLFKRQLATAVERDVVRRVAAAPDPAQLCLASRARPADRQPALPNDEAVLVRLGTAQLQPDIRIEPPLASPLPPHPRAPLVMEVAGTVGLAGGEAEVEGLVRFLLLQLALLPGAKRIRVRLMGGSDELRLAARYLPRTHVMRDGEAVVSSAHGPTRGDSQEVAVLLPGAPPASALALAQAARSHDACVVDGAGALSHHDRVVEVGEFAGLMASTGLRSEFVPDLLGHASFERAAREAGSRSSWNASSKSNGKLPDSCGLDLLVGLAQAELAEAWSARRGKGCWIPLGVTESGPLNVDLVADSPHLLVAGTTGAGKSELLRTMIAGAAARHSPDELTFLLIDFKGGAGLAPLEGLPHSVGLVTDLSGGLRRVLVSLRAEVTWRERLLAEVGCHDIDAYAARDETAPLPRLAVVVDEFRVLVEEEPESLRELLRLASVGRSLGIHLIMATQRPHGAVSADIRANVGCTIALRVNGAAESRDVIGSDLAARVPPALPGRGYLALGGGEPVEFQTAALALAPDQRLSRSELQSAVGWLREGSARSCHGEKAYLSTEAFVQSASEAWTSLGGRLPRRPVAAPLPGSLPDDATPPRPAARRVLLGIADLPHEQRLASLRWVPEEQGHLALIGGPPSAAGAILASIACQLRDGVRTRHLYVLDADASLAHLEHHHRTGAYVRLDDVGHAARVIARLAEAVVRQGGPDSDGPDSGAGPERPSIILIVTGWSRWVSALRHSAHSNAEGELYELIRNHRSAGLVLLVVGDGDLVAARVFGEFRCRLFLPHGTPDDACLGWPRLHAGSFGPARGIAMGLLSFEEPVLVQCFTSSRPERNAFPASETAQRPGLRILPLPTSVTAAQVSEAPIEGSSDRQRRGGGHRRVLAVGVHGDRSNRLCVPLGQGELLLVLGNRGSGKTCFLEALPAMNPGTGPWFSGRLPRAWDDARASARSGQAPILLVDDADQLGRHDSEGMRLALEEGVSLIATAGYGTSSFNRPPLPLPALSAAAGIAIGPRSPADGDVFGVRLGPLEQVVPGRAIAVVGGQQTEVQLGWVGPGGSDERGLSPGGSREPAAA
ncbi:FtsK/SpoIIIE domain-containing protein [Sinomonas susongensis]|uniref:FtsK/SpoIIIE domain-containing protein n=1 Tax=Sinomonas susongensis TaxID=1324851 RepID=UPI001109A7F7|nr:FtsK/SpoIIIE domain-containing protein [Sinomonas susongensis]